MRWPKPKIPFYDLPGGMCRWCGKEIPKSKRLHWHPTCVEEYRFLAWPNETRIQVGKRDAGVCGAGGFDWPVLVERLWTRARQPRSALKDVWGTPEARAAEVESRRRETEMMIRLRAIGFDARSFESLQTVTTWHADHVVPLWAGGPHAMANLWTLCPPHHKAKTSAEAGLRVRAAEAYPPVDVEAAKAWWRERLGPCPQF